MIKSRARKEAMKPMAHQAVSLKHDKTTPIVFDTSDPGTGKTAVRIWAFAERRRKRGGCALVLAPRSLLRSAWANDFTKFAPDMKVSVATADNRTEAFAADADVYVTNHDAVKWVAQQKPKFFERFSELIVDESTAYKHHTSQRSRSAAKIARHFKHRSCLTGTPNGNSITDVWHQVLILDNGKRLGQAFYKFRDTVCTPQQVGRQAHMVNWVDRDGAEEAVFGLLSDITIRHKFEDCVDIPPNHQYEVLYEMPPKQRKFYDELFMTNMMLFGAQASGPKVTAVNASAVATKLLQVASGAVYEGPEKYHLLDTNRYEMVLDLAQEAKHSLVFFLWKHQRDLLAETALKRKMRICVLDGTTTDRERNQMVMAYQAGAYDLMLAHPRSAAHGLTLTKGTRTIWPSPTADLEIFKQGSKRQHRIGQKQKTETIVVLAKDCPVEERIYHDILMGKNKRMTNLLDLFGTLAQEFTPKTKPRARKVDLVEA